MNSEPEYPPTPPDISKLPIKTSHPEGKDDGSELHKAINDVTRTVINSGHDGHIQMMRKLSRAQLKLIDSKNLHAEPDAIICAITIAFLADTLAKHYPHIDDQLAVITPLWMRDPVPDFDYQEPIPPRFGQVQEKSMASLVKECLRRGKKTRYHRKRRKDSVDTKPKELKPDEYNYFAEVLCQKMIQDNTYLESCSDSTVVYDRPLSHVLEFFFGLSADPRSNFEEIKHRKVKRHTEKQINEADILIVFEDTASQTIEALADINDPRHQSARTLIQTLSDQNTKAAKLGGHEKGYFTDYVSMYLSVKDILYDELNVVSYLNQLLEATEITGDPWYFDMAIDIIRVMRNPDSYYEYNRMLSLNDIERYFVLKGSLGKSPQPANTLRHALTEWHDMGLPAIYQVKPQQLSQFNKNLSGKHTFKELKIVIDQSKKIVEFDISLTPELDNCVISPNRGEDTVKTKLTIDISQPSSFSLTPHVIDYFDITPELEAGLLNMTSSIMTLIINNQKKGVPKEKKTTATSQATNKQRPVQKPESIRSPSPKRKKRKRMKQKPARKPTTLTDIVAESSKLTTQARRPTMTCSPEIKIPDGVSRAQIDKKIHDYHSGAARPVILRQKRRGEKVIRLPLGGNRILATLGDDNTAKVFHIGPRGNVYRILKNS